MNSPFKKVRITLDESYKNMSDELNILKPKNLQAVDQILEKKKHPDTDSINDFVARTCVTNISKELTELVIEELNTRNVKFNKKTVQGCDSF